MEHVTLKLFLLLVMTPVHVLFIIDTFCYKCYRWPMDPDAEMPMFLRFPVSAELYKTDLFVCLFIGIKLRARYMLNKQCTTKVHPIPDLMFSFE